MSLISQRRRPLPEATTEEDFLTANTFQRVLKAPIPSWCFLRIANICSGFHAYGNRPYRVFIDGKPLVGFYAAGNTLATIPHWWDFGPDGTLSFLAQDDNSLKRITVTLSPETSLATILGGGTAVARGNN